MNSARRLLENLIKEVITEIQRTRVIDYEKIDKERKEVYDEMRADSDVKPADRINTPDKEAQHLSRLEADTLEDQIEMAMLEPYNQSIDDRIAFAMLPNDDPGFDESYTILTTADVQAIARNMAQKMPELSDKDPEIWKNLRAFRTLLRQVRETLVDEWGLKFIERQRIDMSRRGPRAGVHGRHPFANSGGGGTGMGTGGDGAIGFGIGGGPGAIGGKDDWKPDDPRNLPMGAKKRQP